MSDVYDQGALTQELQRQQSSAATNAVSQVSSVPPAAASQAIVAQKQTGLPARTTMFDPASVAAAIKQSEAKTALAGSPAVSAWVTSADPAHVAAAQDDLPGLAKIAKSISDFASAPWSQLWEQAKAANQAPPHDFVGAIGNAAANSWRALGIFSQAATNVAIGPIGSASQAFAEQQAQKVLGKNYTPVMDALQKALGAIMPAEGIGGLPALAEGAGAIPRGAGGEPVPPGEFATVGQAARAAGPAPEGNRWEPYQTPSGNFAMRPVPFESSVGAPPSGVSPEADSLRAGMADADAANVKAVEDAIAESPIASQSPETMRDFLQAQPELEGKTAYISAAKWEEFSSKLSGKDYNDLLKGLDLFDNQDKINAFDSAYETKSTYGMPLSEYLAAVQGKSYADALREITRFSEDGVSQADAKELWKPEPPRPVEPAPIENLSDWNKVGTKGTGTHSGALYEDTEGTRWMVKGTSGVGDDAARSEVLASQLAKLAGANVPETKLVALGREHDGGLGVASKFIEGLKPADVTNEAHRKGIQGELAAHAWVSNRDVIGTGDYPNLFETPAGKMLSIDQGGSLRYRATLQPKTDFGADPVEWETLRQYPVPKQWFGEMTDEERTASASKLAGASDEKIEDTIRASGVHDPEGLIATMKARRDTILGTGTAWAPPALAPDPELSGSENEALALQAPTIALAAKQAMDEVYLKGVFTDGKALGMSEGDLKRWSEKVRAAQQAVYEKLLAKAKAKIKEFRTPLWKNAYETHYISTANEFTARPEVRARIALTSSETQALDLKTGNALVDDKGEPLTFYRITDYSDTGDGNVPVDLFANPRPVASPHPYWVTTAKSAYWNKGISFGQNPLYAQRSSQHAGEDVTSPYYQYQEGRQPVMWVTHVKAVRSKIGDFRDPADVQKALDWYKKANPQAQNEDDTDFNHRVSVQRTQLQNGAWAEWENQAMLSAVGWDASRMIETQGQRLEPNLFVRNPGIVYWKFDQGSIPVRVRLSSADRNWFPQELLDRVPKGIWAKDGLDSTEYAQQLGFNNGAEMLESIATMEAERGEMPFKDWLERQIKAETALRAKDQLGWDFSPESILEAEARQMVDAPQVEDLLTDSLRGLREEMIRSGVPAESIQFSAADIKARAVATFQAMPLSRALDTRGFERAVRDNSRRVEIGLLRGHPQKMIEAFQNRVAMIENYHMLNLSHGVAAAFRKADAKWSKLVSRPTSKRVFQPYYNRVLQTLDYVGYHLSGRWRGEMLAQLDGQGTPQAFADGLNADGWNLDYTQPRPVGDAKDLSVAEFEQLRRSVNSLLSMGRDAQTIKIGDKRVLVKGFVDAIAGAIRGRGIRFPEGAGKEGKLPSLGVVQRGLFSVLVRPESFWLDVDKDNPNGPAQYSIMKPLQDAKHSEAKLVIKLSEAVREFFEARSKGMLKNLHRQVPDPIDYVTSDGVKRRVVGSAQQNIHMLLHMGNADNMKVLLGGFPGLTRERVLAASARNLTSDELDLVNFLWKQREDLWPMMAETYRELSGVAPPKYSATPFRVGEKEMTGGHVTLRYNKHWAPTEHKGFGEASLFGPEYDSSLPANAAAKLRTGYIGPLLLNLDSVMFGLRQEIHDIAQRKALLDAGKIALHPDVIRAIWDHYGEEYANAVKPWLVHIARESTFNDQQANWIVPYLRMARANAVAAGLAFRASTPMKHFGPALMHSISQVGGPELIKALGDVWGSPLRSQEEIAKIVAESAEMRTRWENLDRDLKAQSVSLLNRQNGVIHAWQHSSMLMIAWSDLFSAAPTYVAARDKALAEGYGNEWAIFRGEQAVRLAHGASSPTDLPALLRTGHDIGSNVFAMSTLFTSFLNVSWNRYWTTGRIMQLKGQDASEGKALRSEAQTLRSLGHEDAAKGFDEAAKEAEAASDARFNKAFSRTFWSFLMAGLWIGGVNHEMKKDPNSSLLGDLLLGLAEQPTGGIPILNQGVKALGNIAEGLNSPLEEEEAATIKTAYDLVGSTYNAMGAPLGWKPLPLAKYTIHDLLNTGGYFTGIGLDGAYDIGDYAEAFVSGRAPPVTGFGAVASGLTHGVDSPVLMGGRHGRSLSRSIR